MCRNDANNPEPSMACELWRLRARASRLADPGKRKRAYRFIRVLSGLLDLREAV
jgi:hypothetical protein